MLLSHRGVTVVTLVGSRSRGEATALSDWDFEVGTSSLPVLEPELEHLVEQMGGLACQWDPYGEWRTFMVMLAGATKVDLVFRVLQPPGVPDPWEISLPTLARVDHHFWDWTLWLGSKTLRGETQLIEAELQRMSRHLLGPLGSPQVPTSLLEAVRAYRAGRAAAEERLGVSVPPRIGDEVLARMRAVLGERLEAPPG